MQSHHIGFQTKGFYRIAQRATLWAMTPKDAQHRLRIVRFFEQHGLAATLDAFEVSRRTLYRWKKALAEANDNPAALAARSSAPHRRRQMQWPKVIIDEIRRLRHPDQFPNLGKAKLHALLVPWCAERGLPCPSVSTIGRLIARAPDKMRHAPKRLSPRGKPLPVRKPRRRRKPKNFVGQPLQLVACDTIERLRDGLRRYVTTFIDPASRISFAWAASRRTSRQARKVFIAMHRVWPQPPQYVLSDNGSEFLGEFEQLLKARGLTHFWTYPNCPRMNPHVERFNRTIQETFVDYHENLLFTDLDLFNRQLAAWLLRYNTILPHHSLGLKSPVQFLLENQPECQRWWTHTVAVQRTNL